TASRRMPRRWMWARGRRTIQGESGVRSCPHDAPRPPQNPSSSGADAGALRTDDAAALRDGVDDPVAGLADSREERLESPRRHRQRSGACGCVAQLAMEADIERPLAVEEARISGAWEQLDAAAADEARAIRDEASVMYGEQLAMYREEMLKEVAQQVLTARM